MKVEQLCLTYSDNCIYNLAKITNYEILGNIYKVMHEVDELDRAIMWILTEWRVSKWYMKNLYSQD